MYHIWKVDYIVKAVKKEAKARLDHCSHFSESALSLELCSRWDILL